MESENNRYHFLNNSLNYYIYDNQPDFLDSIRSEEQFEEKKQFLMDSIIDAKKSVIEVKEKLDKTPDITKRQKLDHGRWLSIIEVNQKYIQSCEDIFNEYFKHPISNCQRFQRIPFSET